MATKTLVTFSPELGQLIADFVREEIAKLPQPKAKHPSPRVPIKRTLTAKITSNDGGSPAKHAWTEQAFNSGSYEDMPDGREGFEDFNYAINPADPDTPIDSDKIVTLTWTPDVSSSTTDGGCWTIAGTGSNPSIDIRLSGDWIQITFDGGSTWNNRIEVVDCSAT